ncbi:hypothetical protein [Streptomyces sp. NPDC049813]
MKFWSLACKPRVCNPFLVARLAAFNAPNHSSTEATEATEASGARVT